ncbi:MAG TPA: adenylate kinase [Acidimicrobiia bacterium]
MHRVSVVGNSGSGKTTVARAISDRLGIPHLELDAIYHQPGWSARPEAEMRRLLTEFVEQDRWVVDGNYTSLGVADLVWPRADTLVWLDLPRRVVMRQVISRTIRRVSTGEELWNGNRERWGNLVDPRPGRNIILWAWTRQAQVRRGYEQRLGDGSWDHLDVIRLGTGGEVRSFLADPDRRADR